jgi:hypothetical protein
VLYDVRLRDHGVQTRVRRPAQVGLRDGLLLQLHHVEVRRVSAYFARSICDAIGADVVEPFAILPSAVFASAG